jgi:predicted Zn-dependent protease with MMP-like domain
LPYETLEETEWEDVDRVWNAIEKGDTEAAHVALRRLERKRRDHPDVRVVAAAVALDDGDAAVALDRLNGAERSADPALFFHLRAQAAYETCRFDAARADAERVLAIQPDTGEAYDLLSRIADHTGDSAAAEEHAREAASLDPDGFPLPLDVANDAFDTIVEKSLAELPKEVSKHLAEWPVIVDALPSREILTAEAPPLSPDLLGLFVGRHLLEQSYADVPGTPGTIHLFRKNLLRACHDQEELEHEIRVTVQHEIGHLLGLDEDDLEDWGLG